MKLTLIQRMSNRTYRIKEIDVGEKMLALYEEPHEVFTSLESAQAALRLARLERVYADAEGEIWV